MCGAHCTLKHQLHAKSIELQMYHSNSFICFHSHFLNLESIWIEPIHGDTFYCRMDSILFMQQFSICIEYQNTERHNGSVSHISETYIFSDIYGDFCHQSPTAPLELTLSIRINKRIHSQWMELSSFLPRTCSYVLLPLSCSIHLVFVCIRFNSLIIIVWYWDTMV